MNLKKLEVTIKNLKEKIFKQGIVANARDESHLEQLVKIHKEIVKQKLIKENK